MIMPKQQNGSAKRFLAYHNVLILHKSEKQTVKDQFGSLNIEIWDLFVIWCLRFGVLFSYKAF